MNQIEDALCKMYIKEQVGINSVCRTCKESSDGKNISHFGPLPVLHVGDEFENDNIKVLIVGYVAYGWEDVKKDTLVNDPSRLIGTVKSRYKELFNKNSESIKTINAIKRICASIYGSMEAAYPKIAITNMIHCNSDVVRGGAPTHMRYSCAHHLAKFSLTLKEIECIQPKKIISIAGSGGNDYLKEWKKEGLLDIDTICLPHPAGSVSFDYLCEEAKKFVGI